jgi:hypothetical protein
MAKVKTSAEKSLEQQMSDIMKEKLDLEKQKSQF